MKLLTRLFWIFPLFILSLEVFFHLSQKAPSSLNPKSLKNESSDQLIQLLNTAKIIPLQLNINDNEISFNVKDKPNHTYKVFISTSQNILNQVNALQKLIKIANIKEKDIQFIDLGSKRPYATL